MKMSARALRMQRHHKRMSQVSKLSLVSLMDIFTILVFFLMMNASEVQVLQTHKSVQLPQSSAEAAAQETLLLMVNDRDILLQGQKLASVEQVLASATSTIEALDKELRYQASRSPDLTEQQQVQGRAITIMGDKAIPYQLLRAIMQTCAAAGYTNIALAVEQVDNTTPLEVSQ
ncbi:ExbD/TolR family protein [Neptunicella sp. SCSIO 80796]|uniref:ExbD/TolR family protein n=1 Tax=Neptunicella plasticusilytica TaxID=3117012 RepID=UPI003A4E513B